MSQPTLHQLITERIAELDSNGAGPAAEYFGVTKQEMAVIKRKKQYPFDFAERIFVEFDYDDTPQPMVDEVLPPEEDMIIEEPEAAAPAGGRTPPAGSTAPMTVAPGVRPSNGSPMVVAPRTGALQRAPGVVRVTPEGAAPAGTDLVSTVVAVLQAMGVCGAASAGHPDRVIELPGGNAADHLPEKFGKNWNVPYRQPAPQVEPPRAGPQRSRPVIRRAS